MDSHDKLEELAEQIMLNGTGMNELYHLLRDAMVKEIMQHNQIFTDEIVTAVEADLLSVIRTVAKEASVATQKELFGKVDCLRDLCYSNMLYAFTSGNDAIFVYYLPPQLRTFVFSQDYCNTYFKNHQLYKINKNVYGQVHVQLYMPHQYFVVLINNNSFSSLSAYTSNTYPGPESMLYPYPLPNVNTDGSVCLAAYSKTLKTGEQFTDIAHDAVNTFLMGTHTTSLPEVHKKFLEYVGWENIGEWSEQSVKGIAGHAMGKYITDSGSTLRAIIDKRWSKINVDVDNDIVLRTVATIVKCKSDYAEKIVESIRTLQATLTPTIRGNFITTATNLVARLASALAPYSGKDDTNGKKVLSSGSGGSRFTSSASALHVPKHTRSGKHPRRRRR